MDTLPESVPTAPPANTTKWPQIIGIIGAIFGALGVLSLPMAFVQQPLMKLSMQTYVDTGATTQEAVDRFVEKWSNHQSISAIALVITSVFLLAGGILLARRKKLSALLLQIWAVLFILYGGYTSWYSSEMVNDQMALFFGNETEADDILQMMQGFLTIGMIIGFLFTLILPVFFFVWFNRTRIRAEVRGWA